ncbi:MAG: S1 RNA-binding domain-containing protein [Clostridiales bacterium]|nr:S1 RNA-binding domain-containing protein [Clostridiales bacterium]
MEKLEDCVGQRLDVTPITVDSAKKRLVLSARNVLKEREAKEKEAKMAAVKVGAVVKGKVDSIKDYGAFIELDGGLSGLLHVSQISNQRVKSPAAVLKEGQEVTVKIIALKEGKISLSMKALEADGDARDTEVFDYKETGKATTSLGALLKGIKL